MKLDPINKPQQGIEFAVVDIESMNWVNFLVIGFYSPRLGYHHFLTLRAFFDFVDEFPVPKNIFAHFGGKFDFMFLISELAKNESINISSIIPRGSSILCFDYLKNKDQKITFRDSAALLPFSLKSLTENFNVKTKKGDWDHSKTTGVNDDLLAYLKSDCIGLYQCLEKFYEWPLIKKAGPAFTLAGQAMRVFRTYLKNEMWSLGKTTSEFCRKAYLGGRTEIFNPFCTQKLYEYEVNSLYPFVMSENYFPTGKDFWVYELKKDKLGIYEAEVECDKSEYIPCLGIIRDKKYIFPVGKFSGHWTSAELLYAKSLGYKIKIKKGICFQNQEKLFFKYIRDLYAIRTRSEKNSVDDILAKLLMNSSYGRFGMNPKKENITFNLSEGVKEYIDLQVGSRKIQIYKKPVELETYTHVAIAAFVTSYARIHMHKLMRKCGKTLYYTDTDSLFTTKADLPSGKNLGQLKLEGTYKSAVFLLPKTYLATGDDKIKVAMKGFDKKKIRNFDYDDFKNALEGDLRRFKIENEPKFATFKSALAQKKFLTMSKANTKQLKAKYDKRLIIKGEGTFETEPLFLKERE